MEGARDNLVIMKPQEEAHVTNKNLESYLVSGKNVEGSAEEDSRLL